MKKLITILCLAPFIYLWNGFVLMKLWGWFMVPQFGLPVLSLSGAIGVGMVVSFLIHRVNHEKELTEIIVAVVTFPALALLAGWIVTLFQRGVL